MGAKATRTRGNSLAVSYLIEWFHYGQSVDSHVIFHFSLISCSPPTFKEWANAINTTVPELKKQIRRSQKSKAALVEANLRLVVTVARQTVKKGHSEINFQDACQEGILGLTRATEKFDPEKGFRFSSYAVWWIKKMIHKNVSDQSRQVRLPANVMRKINDIRIHEKVLQDELGRKAKDEEVAEKVGLTVEQLAFYRKSANKVISLDKKVKFTKESDNASNTPTMNDMVKDPSLSPAELAQKQMLKEDVRRLIKTLSPREQAVIRMRFGLDNGTPRTLAQIGDKFSVDKEMIRKIEAKALRKLRQPYRNQSLKSYITDL
jgi:RNA polymerase primary sigma factor